MLHRVNIVPQTRVVHSDLTGCDVKSTYGYRATCTCKWRGRVRATVTEARADFAEHRLDLLRP
jgi:hypothetical protein